MSRYITSLALMNSRGTTTNLVVREVDRMAEDDEANGLVAGRCSQRTLVRPVALLVS